MELDYKKLLKEMEGLTVEQLKSRILALEAENNALKMAIEVYKKNLEEVLANKEAKFIEKLHGVKQKC
jgi:hypothetical protein